MERKSHGSRKNFGPESFGILLVDKPSGPTSHDIVFEIRKATRERRVGHTGTLDPLASGLLVICIGAATRLSEYLTSHPKRYRARVRLGQVSTTYDADGRLTPLGGPMPDEKTFAAALAPFRGTIMQTPPAFSAVKQGGRRAYDMARKGEPVDLQPRSVTIDHLELLEWMPPFALLEVGCSAGTYIRSLANDVGKALGCGAHIVGLRRLGTGPFTVEQALSFEKLKAACRDGSWKTHLISPDEALIEWPKLALTQEEAHTLRHGQTIPLTDESLTWARAYDAAGRFFAILRADPDAGLWKPHKVFLPDD